MEKDRLQESLSNAAPKTRVVKKRKVRIRKFRVFMAILILCFFIYSLFFVISKFCKRSKFSKNNSKKSSKISLGKIGSALNLNNSPTPSQTQISIIKTKIDVKNLEKEIKSQLGDFKGSLSLIFYDFGSKKRIEILGDEVFESASLIKIPVMVEVFRQIEDGTIRSDKEIELMESYKVGGSGLLKNEKSGTRWTIEKLTELMIKKSDNTATDMLIDVLGMKNIEKTAQEIGMKSTILRRKIFDFKEIDKGNDNKTTPKDIEIIFKELYEGKKLGVKDQYRGQMLNILKGQSNKKIIPRYISKKVPIAHKTGSLTGTVHDCGIVYVPNRHPYLLILMSKNVPDNKKAEENMAKISEIIYKHVIKN